MGTLFSPDSKLMQTMSRVADLVILNLLFLFSCIPLVTIGAASAALYTVCFRIGTDREEGIFPTYFRAFRDNWKQNTLLWLIAVVFLGAGIVNLFLFYSMEGPLHYIIFLMTLLMVLEVFTYSYTFPLVSQFRNKTLPTLKNALLLSLGYLPRSMIIAVVNVFPLALALADPYLFLQMGFIWVFLYFSAAAYINTLLLKKVFAPYLS